MATARLVGYLRVTFAKVTPRFQTASPFPLLLLRYFLYACALESANTMTTTKMQRTLNERCIDLLVLICI